MYVQIFEIFLNKNRKSNRIFCFCLRNFENENKKHKCNQTSHKLLKHLPSGGNPPATDDGGGLLELRDSKLEEDSVSGVINLLPELLVWDKFCKTQLLIRDIDSNFVVGKL